MSSDLTVLLQLQGPMQAWGTYAPWDTLPVSRRPTKSGVVGLVANTLGRDRADDISDLASLRFSVRIDRPGHLMNDDQTAGGGTFIPLTADYVANPELAAFPDKWIYGAPRAPYRRPSGELAAPWKPAARTVVVRSKGYLVDAAFVVGLTGAAEVIDRVVEGLRRPQRLPFLGRRNCPLAEPPLWGVTSDAEWQITAPLLRNATDFRPRFWYETAPVADSVGYPEQPDGVITRRRMMHLRWTRLPALLTPVEIGAPQ